MSGDRLRIGDRTERRVLFAAEAFRASPERVVKLSAPFDDRVVFFDGVLQERKGVGAVFAPVWFEFFSEPSHGIDVVVGEREHFGNGVVSDFSAVKGKGENGPIVGRLTRKIFVVYRGQGGVFDK